MSIEDVIEEFNLIKDDGLRKKCISVWEKALREHNLTPNDLKNIPFCPDIPPDDVNMVEHIRAVAQTATHLAGVYESVYNISIRSDVLAAAALLHDVGKLDEHKNPLLEHSLSSVLRAKDAGLGEEILHAISFHSEATGLKRRSVEAELLYFADFAHYRPLLLRKDISKKS